MSGNKKIAGEQPLRLTMAQALVRYLSNQQIETDDGVQRYFGGVWSIFGHGNVAGLGEALYAERESLPTFRGQNEQSMAHAAIAYAKANFRRSAMICTSSIGPGATNFVTAAALAHVNRLPVLFLPGDIFATRAPDPVLQQVENFSDGWVSANDCLRPVSRYFDRITRPEQILSAAPRAMAMFMDPASCGPATLALCQDVQSEAFDFPEDFFASHVWRIRRPYPDSGEITDLSALIKSSKRPMIIAGGGVIYSSAEQALCDLAEKIGAPVAETQAGKGALPFNHPLNLGAIGVTGSPQANDAAREADLIIGVGTRLQDFTTASRTLYQRSDCRFAQINVAPYDAHKHFAAPVVGDARSALEVVKNAVDPAADDRWRDENIARARQWRDTIVEIFSRPPSAPFRYSDVIAAVDEAADDDAIVLCAAGTLPGDLHKLWRTKKPGGYHMEYGYSCMGYEIAGGLGARMAQPDREVFVLAGDGSYLMLNSELVTAAMMGVKMIVVILDNRGFGCINNLQQSTGGAPFNNLFAHSIHAELPEIDFAAHAASMGVHAEKAADRGALTAALNAARERTETSVIAVEVNASDPDGVGGAWWDVPPAEVSDREEVNKAYRDYIVDKKKQQRGG